MCALVTFIAAARSRDVHCRCTIKRRSLPLHDQEQNLLAHSTRMGCGPQGDNGV
jgi:hypothetical protein